MGKKEKTRAWGVFPKTKRRKILIVCRCLRIPWLYLNSSRHLFEEWPTPHWLVPYTFWCRPPFQVYFQMHLLMLGTCSTTIQYELSSLQFAQWVHAPKFPSHTNFSNCGSNQCWADIQKIQIPARISKIDIQWISLRWYSGWYLVFWISFIMLFDNLIFED